MTSRLSRGQWRLNALLTAVLVLVVFALGNRLVRQHLHLRRDLSEERLHSLNPATTKLLGELQDVLQVEGYLTGEPEHAAVQIAKGRLLDLLRELQLASRGRLEFRSADPNTSTEARLEAEAYGIVPAPIGAVQGTAAVTQRVYLGLVLRYRGNEAVLPWVLPQNLESDFARALRGLQREEPLVVGFLGSGDFVLARDALAQNHRLREVTGLAEGADVPAALDVMVVARPAELHPRAAFAIDQYVQGGGRALLLIDRHRVSSQMAIGALETGLDGVLAAWGIAVSRELVFDLRCDQIVLQSTQEPRPYFYFPRVDAAGLNAEHPVTSPIPAAFFFWSQAIDDALASPEGVERTALIHSSERSYLVPQLANLTLDPENLDAQAAELLSGGAGVRRPLAVALSGRLPSAFAERGAPVPHDPSSLEQLLWEERARAAREAGEPEPPPPATTTDEVVLSAENPAQVIVFADADWASDTQTFFRVENRLLFENAVDWLGLEEDLLAIRSRLPRDRQIRDFLAEEREARGLIGGDGGFASFEREVRESALEGEARRAAARARWLHMLGAVGLSLLLFGALFALVRLPRWLNRGGPR